MALKTCIEIIESDNGEYKIFLDIQESDDILKAIYRNTSTERRFKTIVADIFRRQTRKDKYEQYPNFEGTAVFKLSKGKENIRIYCKVEWIESESNNLVQHIILCKEHHKKNQELSKVEVRILRAIQVKEYEYKRLY